MRPGAPPTPVPPSSQAGDGAERGTRPCRCLPGRTPAARPLSAPEGEQKPVTVLCGELVEAKALVMRMGPEAMHYLMQVVFALAQEVVQRYDSTIVQFGGPGFQALFGAAVAQEDHARRAVLAVVALQQHLNERLSSPGCHRGKRRPSGSGSTRGW